MNQSHEDRYAHAARNAPAWREVDNSTLPDDPPTEHDPREHSRRFWIVLFLLASFLACVVGAVVVPGGLGLIAGYQELQSQNHELAIQHFNRGLGFLAENYPELAYTEFEIAVKFDGTFEPAQSKLSEMQATVGNNGTPGAQQEDRVAAALFDDASTLVANKNWSDAITRLEQLRTLKRDYRTVEVSDMLYNAYVSGGKNAVVSGQIELARERFDSALALRNSDPQIVQQRDLALLYLDGQQAAGYNWQTATQKFAALYQQDPNYYDVKKRLVDAYTAYAELALRQNASCLAVREYDGALAINKDTTLADKRAQAMVLCKQAISATPTPATTGTEEYVFTRPTVAEKSCNGAGDVSGVVQDALGRPIAGAAIGYYADGITLTATRTNANGQYQLVLGKDAGLLHVVALSADGKTPVGLAADVDYPGGNNAGCHVVIDWQKVQ